MLPYREYTPPGGRRRDGFSEGPSSKIVAVPDFLTIRRAQMERLGQVPGEVFVEQLADRCFDYHPVPARLAGRPAVVESARQAVAAAAAAGYNTRVDVSRWYSMTLWFGHGFARDPQLPWIAEWLTAPAKSSKIAGAQLAALDYLDRITGLHGRYHLQALRSAAASEPLGFTARPGQWAVDLRGWIVALWPAKAARTGDAALSGFLDTVALRAARYDLRASGEVAVFASIAWFLGCDFDTDPLFPWAAKALREPAAQFRAEQLERMSRNYLALALAAFENH